MGLFVERKIEDSMREFKNPENVPSDMIENGQEISKALKSHLSDPRLQSHLETITKFKPKVTHFNPNTVTNSKKMLAHRKG